MEPLTQRRAWRALSTHYEEISRLHLRDLFVRDPGRGERLTAEGAGLFLDYSKNRITDDTIALLIQLAEESGLRPRIAAMFRGDNINVTENRAVLHVALRAPKGTSIVVDGENVVPGVHAMLERMAEFSDRVRSGEWKGHTGRRIRNVINIGIGGLRSRAGHGLRGAQALQRPNDDVPVRLERRRNKKGAAACSLA
jgi:glucose-6-phosphate isomerase